MCTDGGAAMRVPPISRSMSMSRFASSRASMRRFSSSTIHCANPMALSTVRPASAICLLRSDSFPPPLTNSRSVGIHGSMPSYPAAPAISTSFWIPSFGSRIVLVFRQKRKPSAASRIAGAGKASTARKQRSNLTGSSRRLKALRRTQNVVDQWTFRTSVVLDFEIKKAGKTVKSTKKITIQAAK